MVTQTLNIIGNIAVSSDDFLSVIVSSLNEKNEEEKLEDIIKDEEEEKKAEEDAKKAEEQAKKAEEEAKKNKEKETNNTQKTETPIKSSTGSYYIKINKSANTVTVYTKDGNGNYTVPVKSMVCSTGYASPSSGVYSMRKLGTWHSLMGGVYGQYCTQITGDFLFHSVPYLRRGDNASLEYWAYDKLGTTASAGCVRLTTADAQWIYYNCSNGTNVEFYSSSNPGPLGKPTATKISSADLPYRNWDPTDPNPNNPWKTNPINKQTEINNTASNTTKESSSVTITSIENTTTNKITENTNSNNLNANKTNTNSNSTSSNTNKTNTNSNSTSSNTNKTNTNSNSTTSNTNKTNTNSNSTSSNTNKTSINSNSNTSNTNNTSANSNSNKSNTNTNSNSTSSNTNKTNTNSNSNK